jgi:hypothetical protein
MLAKQFIDKLEGTGLLHPDIIAELRRQLADTKGRVTVEALAKLLVDNGHLTKFQATKLVAEMRDDSPPAAPPPPKAPAATSAANDLDLAPLEGTAVKPSAPPAKPVAAPNEVEEVEVVEAIEEVIEETPVVEIVEDVTEVVEVIEAPRKKKTPSAAPAPATSIFPAAATAPESFTDPMTPSPRPKLPAKTKRNPWEDFRILGVGSFLCFLLLIGAALLWWFFRGTADDLIEQANKAYEGQSYETAEKFYSDFIGRFTSVARWPN